MSEVEKDNKDLIDFCVDLQLYVKSLFLENENVKSFQQIRKATYLHAKKEGREASWGKEFEGGESE